MRKRPRHPRTGGRPLPRPACPPACSCCHVGHRYLLPSLAIVRRGFGPLSVGACACAFATRAVRAAGRHLGRLALDRLAAGLGPRARLLPRPRPGNRLARLPRRRASARHASDHKQAQISEPQSKQHRRRGRRIRKHPAPSQGCRRNGSTARREVPEAGHRPSRRSSRATPGRAGCFPPSPRRVVQQMLGERVRWGPVGVVLVVDAGGVDIG